MAELQVSGLYAAYGEKTVLSGAEFHIGPGITGLLGANGSGKTTLLKAVGGILPHRGSCLLDGAELSALPPKKLAQLCGYIPQRSTVPEDITLLDAVLMGFFSRLQLLQRPTRAMEEQAASALEAVGLGEKTGMLLSQLSEGQKQLCSLARALVSRPGLFLLDEPESALDFRCRHEFMEKLEKTAAKTDAVALVALHDPNLALNFCQRLLLLEGGKIISQLHPRQDDLPKMEAALGKIYGPVHLHRAAGSILMLRA